MPEKATIEFWRDLKPIAEVFKPDAKPEAYVANAPTDDDFVHETPGEGHTLVAYEHEQPMRVFFIVKAPLVWLDEAGTADGYFDVHDDIAMCRAHYEKVGLGAAYIDKLFR